MFKKLLSIFTVFTLLVPSMVTASVYQTDSNIRVYPDSEIVNFLTSIGSKETREIIIENTGTKVRTINVVNQVSKPFILESSESIKLDAQSSKTLSVSFDPATEGHFSETIKLELLETGEVKEIQLRAHARAAITNEGLRFSSKKVKFEKTAVGQKSHAGILISNTNSYDVKMYASQMPSGAITLDQRLPAVIKSGESIELHATFAPKKTGSFNQSLTIKTTDYKKSTLFVTFRGSAIEGKGEYSSSNLLVAQNDIDLGHVKVGTQIMQKIQIRNTGKTQITFESKRDMSFKLTQTAGDIRVKYPRVLHAGQTDYISVIYTAKKFGARSEVFTISNDSINLPELKISASAVSVTSDSQVKLPEAPRALVSQKVSKGAQSNQAKISELGYSKNLNTINIDAKQQFIFGLNLSTYSHPVTVSYKITNTDTKHTVYAIKYNQVLPKSQSFSWNGRNAMGDAVSAAKYSILIEVRDGQNKKTIKDSIQISRNYQPVTRFQAKPQPKATLKKEVEINPYPSRTKKKRLPAADESLITQLSINPIVATQKETIQVSLNTRVQGQLSIELLKNNKVIQTAFLNRTVNSGFHYELAQFDTAHLTNGTYDIRARLNSPTRKDTDLTSLYINSIANGTSVYQKKAAVLVHDGPKSQESQLAFLDFLNRKPEACNNTQDIEADTQLCRAFNFALGQGYISDTEYFRGETLMTRAQAMKLIVALNNLPVQDYKASQHGNLGYSDLNIHAWYMPYINTLIKDYSFNHAYSTNSARNIIRGYRDGTLRPDEGISRAEFYKLLIKAVDSSIYTELNTQIDYYIQKKPFTDTLLSRDNQWFLPYAQIVKNLSNGTGFASKYFGSRNLNSLQARFDAGEKVTRAEFIEFIYLAASKNLIEFK